VSLTPQAYGSLSGLATTDSAFKRRDSVDESLADIGRSYNVSVATISRLTA
jgi:hypothetical protein